MVLAGDPDGVAGGEPTLAELMSQLVRYAELCVVFIEAFFVYAAVRRGRGGGLAPGVAGGGPSAAHLALKIIILDMYTYRYFSIYL